MRIIGRGTGCLSSVAVRQNPKIPSIGLATGSLSCTDRIYPYLIGNPDIQQEGTAREKGDRKTESEQISL